MNAELSLVAERLERAQVPEEVFGSLVGAGAERLAGLKAVYHQLAKLTHPDVYALGEDQRVAEAAFRRLVVWYIGAEAKIKAGSYGAADVLVLRTKKYTYTLDGAYAEGWVYNRYACKISENGSGIAGAEGLPGVMKLVRDADDNALAHNEARAVQLIRCGKAGRKFGAYLPALVESFVYTDEGIERQANVFEAPAGWYSLEDVRRAYPGGIDPRDMAWIFRRVLVALGLAHLNGVVHAAVLPGHILILPEAHGLVLDEWSYAICDGGGTNHPVSTNSTDNAYRRVMNAGNESWYPLEVRQHVDRPLPGTDIYMAAKCMIYLLGGQVADNLLPEHVPGPIRAFLKGCTLPGKKSRPSDAWALKDEFDELLDRLWGARAFHPFSMP